MGRWANFAVMVMALSVALPSGALAAQTASPQTDTANQITEFIEQLGDSSYAVRQRASKRLVELGICTRPYLIQALDRQDAEIRFRAAQALRQVVEADFRVRLDAFAKDLDGKQQCTLPSWGQFRKTFGEDKVARTLFVEMQRSEPDLLEAFEENTKLTSEILVARMQTLPYSTQFTHANGQIVSLSLGTIATLLFVSATDEVSLSDREAFQLNQLIHQSTFESNLRGASPRSAILKRLLGSWILNNSESAAALSTNLTLALNFDLKEGLELAASMIAREGTDPAKRQYAILAIGRFGDHQHIALLEPLLKDATPCSAQQNVDPRQSQIRDVALAVLIHLSGQELKDYGLGHVQTNSQTLFQPGTIVFGDAITREAALRKWSKWASPKPSKD